MELENQVPSSIDRITFHMCLNQEPRNECENVDQNITKEGDEISTISLPPAVEIEDYEFERDLNTNLEEEISNSCSLAEQSYSEEEINEYLKLLKRRLSYVAHKLSNGWDHLDLSEITSLFHHPSPSNSKCSDPKGRENEIISSNMNPLETLGLLAGIIHAKSETKDQIDQSVSKCNEQSEFAALRCKLYPNLHEFTCGVWDAYTEHLDSKSKNPENYGSMGTLLLSKDKVNAIVSSYEKELYFQEIVRRHMIQQQMNRKHYLPSTSIYSPPQKMQRSLIEEKFHILHPSPLLSPPTKLPKENLQRFPPFMLTQPQPQHQFGSVLSLDKYKISPGMPITPPPVQTPHPLIGIPRNQNPIAENVPSPELKKYF